MAEGIGNPERRGDAAVCHRARRGATLRRTGSPVVGARAGRRLRSTVVMVDVRAHVRSLPDFLFRHPWLTFFLMGASFILFGFTSVNLYALLAANLSLYVRYGTQVIADGALTQLVGLLGSLVLSVLFYLLFALCDRVLVRRITQRALRERRVE
jgi:hypothetical protein